MKIDLIQGDAIEIMRTLPVQSIDLILCDPPFFYMKKQSKYRQIRENTKNKLDEIEAPKPTAYFEFWKKFMIQARRLIKSTGWLIFKADVKTARITYPISITYLDFINELIWDKMRIGLGYYIRKQHEYLELYRPKNSKSSYISQKTISQTRNVGWHGNGKGVAFSSILRVPKRNSGELGKENDLHINQTPPKLWSKIITHFCPPRGKILDPFMGSGSVGIASKQLGRDYIGIDLERKYVNLATKLIEATQSSNLKDFLKKNKKGGEKNDKSE